MHPLGPAALLRHGAMLRHALGGLLAYPAVAAALLLGLVWPWRRPLPGFVLGALAGSPERGARELAELRLRVQRVWVRVMPPARRLGPFALPFASAIEQWRFHRRAGAGPLAWCAALAPALRFAPRSPVPAAHGWHRPEQREQAWKFLEGRQRNHALQMIRCLEEDCRWRSQHFSKLELFRRCRAAGLPSVPVLASFAKGRSAVLDPEALGACSELFSKPDLGVAGRGSYAAWRRLDGEDAFLGSDGRRRSLAQLFAHLEERSRREGTLLLQPRLHNHPAIRDVTRASALCCVRLITCRSPQGELAIVPGWCVLKVASGPGVVDNVAGGDATRYVVDLETGALRTTAGEALVGEGGERVGLPFWDATRRLCLQAHEEALRGMAAVGWDVGITAGGPVLVEGNVTYLGPGTASRTGPYCGDGPLAGYLLEHFRRIGEPQLLRLRERCARRGAR